MTGNAIPTPTGTGSVQSVARAFEVLEALAAADHDLPLAEIAGITGLAQPTVHRLLKTLQALGYARQSDSRAYALGSGLINLGERATPPLAVRAQPLLRELEHLSQETANLVVLDGEMAVYVAQAPSRHQMRMFTELGRRVLPHSAGAGKAILSMLPEPRVRQIVGVTGLPRFTGTTLTSIGALLADLRETRRRGFAIDDGEHEVGVRCIAMAIPGSFPPAALSVSGPAARITEEATPLIVEGLRSAAQRLAANTRPASPGGQR